MLSPLNACRTWLAVLAFVMSTSTWSMEPDVLLAPSQTPSTPKMNATLVSSPGFCELAQGQTHCESVITLIWESPTLGDYCIWDANDSVPMQCWENQVTGTIETVFHSDKKRKYILKQGESGVVVVETSVAVTGSLQQRQRAKRRRKFWRMF